MTVKGLLTPALLAALALNILGIIWLDRAGTEIPQAPSRPTPTTLAGCVEPAAPTPHRHALR
jgi:hypothetical protein